MDAYTERQIREGRLAICQTCHKNLVAVDPPSTAAQTCWSCKYADGYAVRA